LEKQESLELQRRSVMAQEKQLLSEQQRQQQNYRPLYIPAYGFNRFYPYNRIQPPPNGGWDYSNHNNHDGWQHNQPNMYPPYQPYKEPPPPPFRSSSIPRKTQ
jgi:hypothetical protein